MSPLINLPLLLKNVTGTQCELKVTLKDVARVDRFKIFQQFVILASDRYDLEVRDA